MKTAAFILCLLSTIVSAFALIPLIWMIPMTIKVYKASKGEVDLSTGFNICVLLFVNLIGGILLLVDDN